MNVVTTKWLVEDVTPKLGIEYLENLGITTMDEDRDAYAPLGLGGISNGVTNLELTGAYAAIANGGVYTEPILYSKILDKDGKPLTEEKTVQIPAFKVVSVFDVSQTEGEPLPSIAVNELSGSVQDYQDFFKALEQASPVPIGFEDIEGGAHGYSTCLTTALPSKRA